MNSRAWIAWETQRRSLNLSRKLGAERFIFDDENMGPLRYPLSAVKTLFVLWKYRGRQVFVQFPSLFLAALAGFLKPVFRYTLVVDRHTDFSLELKPPFGWRAKVILFLGAYATRKADRTLVTNSEMAEHIDRAGGKSFVLPDPYPDLPIAPWSPPEEPLEVLFVSTWAEDEPILSVMEACRLLGAAVRIHISGRMKKQFEKAVSEAPPNFVPTGFLSDGKYFELMSRVDCVMAVTTRPATLVCGAYEAISMGKPMVLGDTRVSREYFREGALYTDGTASDMASKLLEARIKLPALRRQVLHFQEQSRAEWDKQLQDLNSILETAR